MAQSADHRPQDVARERLRKIASLRHREEERRTKTLAAKLDLPYRDLTTMPIDGNALTLRDLAEQQAAQAAIVRRENHTVTVAALNPESEKLKTFVASLEQEGLGVELLVASATGLAQVWAHYARFAHLKTRITGEVAVSQELLDRFQQEILDIRNLTNRLTRIKSENTSELVELLLAGALRLQASDIHVEPQKGRAAKLRFRLDGVLHDLVSLRANVYQKLLERLKLLAGLKLNVTQRGQDGRITIHARGQDIEIRVSTLPGPAGEFIVMRLLNPESLLDIHELGLRDDLRALIEEELRRPNGMLLTTGPTGSGKTTMLYAFLKRVATPEKKTITIEDPIEYRIEGIEQTQVNPEAGYTFAVGLRSIVRQDPDIILVGEIRDQETASIAMHAGLTGHLVFSTLHTNDAAGAIPRLIDLGINPTVIAPALNTVMAQRLVRRVCQTCGEKEPLEPELRKAIETIFAVLPEELRMFDLAKVMVRKPKGCLECHGTGYRGRIGIFEVFRIDETAEKLVLEKPGVAQLRAFAVEHGMVTLQQDALLRYLQGITTLEEVVRVTGPLKPPHEAEVPMEPEDHGDRLISIPRETNVSPS